MWQIQSWREAQGWSRIELATHARCRVGAIIALEELRYSLVTVDELAMILLALGRPSGDADAAMPIDDDLRGLAEWEQ